MDLGPGASDFWRLVLAHVAIRLLLYALSSHIVRVVMVIIALLRGGRSTGRVITLMVVAAATIFSANVVFGQTVGGYPGGARDLNEWYFCWASRSNPESQISTNAVWTDITCDQLLWQEVPGGGGVYESLMMEVGVGMSGPQWSEVHGMVVPPAGIQKFTYHCIAFGYGQRTTAASLTYGIGAQGVGGSVSSDGTSWLESVTNPEIGSVASFSYDVVATWRATEYDYWAANDVVSTWSSGGTSGTPPGAKYVGWRVYAGAQNSNATAVLTLGCTITDWQSWSQWLEDGNPPWVPPIGCDLFIDCYVVDPYPIEPITWTPKIIPTVVTTVEFGIGQPITATCYDIIPSTQQSVSTWFGDYTFGFESVSACVRERSLSLQLDEFDFGSWAVGLFGFMGVGVLWLMLRR